MRRVFECITLEHDLWLVALAAVVCLLGCYACFSLLHRAWRNPDRPGVWLAGAAITAGAGIWATHFVAMLAYVPPWPISFDVPLTALSALIAIAAIAVAFFFLQRGHALAGGVIAAMAIAAMHYTGMAAVIGPVEQFWERSHVAASLIAPVLFAAPAFHFSRQDRGPRDLLAAVGLMVLAICSMHFTAMSALSMTYNPLAGPHDAIELSRPILAVAVAAIAAVLLGAGMISAVWDSYVSDRDHREAERLRRYVAELEQTQDELQQTAQELQTALDEAAALSQAKSQFLAVMSHELRTPLNAILGFSELMTARIHGPLGDTAYDGYAADIHDSGRHLLDLINDVLDFSRLEGSGVVLDEGPVDMNGVIEHSTRMVAPQAEQGELTVNKGLPAAPVMLRGDERRIKQVCLNLLSNAVKFTPPGGSVAITLDLDADGILLKVSDTGVGIAPEDIPRAMEAFSQVDSSLNRKYEGTGLGLPLCARLVDLHEGSIALESEPGVGTTVSVRLPRERLLLSEAA